MLAKSMDPISQGVAENAIWASITAAAKTILGLLGRRIRITSPRPQETLSGAEPLGAVHCYPVHGTLKKLPKGHEIWLLTQNHLDGSVLPQGFFPVQYNGHDGTWMGKSSGNGRSPIKVIAVVAPPTSVEFFQYFQKMGQLREYQFEPLPYVPPECVNQDSVQAKLPD